MTGERETGLLASSGPPGFCSALGPLAEALLLRGGRSLPGSSMTYQVLKEFLPPPQSKSFDKIFFTRAAVADPNKWLLFLQAQHDILYQLS